MKPENPIPPLPLSNVLDDNVLDDSERKALETVWQQTSVLETTSFPTPNRIETIRATVQSYATQNATKPRLYFLNHWVTYASIAAVFILAFTWFYWTSQPIQFTSPAGMMLSEVLPDGSKIMLNSVSTLTYQDDATTRNVSLAGEAFFEVTANGTPFIVETPEAIIHVVGTAFNVHTRKAKTIVSVTKGIVQVKALQTHHTLELVAGETLTIDTFSDAPPRIIKNLNPEATTAWQVGNLVFYQSNLQEIIEELERRFAVKIQFLPQSNANKQVTWALKSPNGIETVLDDLCGALALRYRKIKDGFQIFDPTLAP